MTKVIIYTKLLCPYCDKAKDLLHSKDINFEEIDIGTNLSKRKEMETRSNGNHTVPQIFIGDKHVGGCDDLYSLDKQGSLDSLLQG
ncbi:MAG: Glutaredoxin 3 [Hyphomicrobiaceae bacterium hypho_1]